MLNNNPYPWRQPMIVKHVQPCRAGIQSHNMTRHSIGYVLSGRKYVYQGDTRREIGKGDMFYLGVGCHHTEEIPEAGRPFEQIVFYYTPEQVGWILSQLSVNYGLSIENDHVCGNCRGSGCVICPGWSAVNTFFDSIDMYMKDDVFSHDHAAESIKMTELAYLILSRPDCCIKGRMLGNMDTAKENFEQTVYRYIFTDASVEELAGKCNRSLTSFKKEFRRHFLDPPHKWFIRQRLAHSRLLLISTDRSISEVGIGCSFPNTSHFIKLFRKEYGLTPASYRQRHRQDREREVDADGEKETEAQVRPNEA